MAAETTLMLPEEDESEVALGWSIRALDRVSFRLRKLLGLGPPQPKLPPWECSYCGKGIHEFHEPSAHDSSIAGTCYHWKQERREKRQKRIADLAALVAGGFGSDPYRGTPLAPRVAADQAWAIAQEIYRKEKE